jgi:hypothetical protein
MTSSSGLKRRALAARRTLFTVVGKICLAIVRRKGVCESLHALYYGLIFSVGKSYWTDPDSALELARFKEG